MAEPASITVPTRPAGHVAAVLKRKGAATGWAAWSKPKTTLELLPVELNNAMAPEYPRAKCEMNIADLRIDVWRWREFVEPSDAVWIYPESSDEENNELLFIGFINEVDFSFDRSEQAIFTAVGTSYRLLHDADYLVYGRYMRCGDGEMRLITGLPCVFNAGGRPNMSPETDNLETHIDARSRFIDVPFFTHDGDPNAQWWTIGDIFRYLMWRYNFDQN